MYSLTGLIVMLIMAAWTYYEFRKVEIARIENSIQNQLELFDLSLTNFLVEAENNVQALSENDLILSSEGNNFTNFLTANESTFQYRYSDLELQLIDLLNSYRTSRSYVNSAYIGYENGDFVRSHPRSSPTQYDPRTRPWYILARENPGKIMMTDPYRSVTNPDINIGIVKALLDKNNKVFGVIGTDITLVNLTNFISGFEIGYSGQLMIVDPKGIILASKDQNTLFTNIDTILPSNSTDLLSKDDGVLSTDKSYYIFHTANKTGWKIVAAIPIAVINRTVQQSAFNPPLISLVITITLFALLSLAGLDFFISKPLIELNEITRQNIQSDYKYRQVTVKTNDEIGQLGSSYNQMIEMRMNSEVALKQERDLARALTESVAVLVKTLDFEQVLDFILEQLSRVVPNDAANIMLIKGDKAYISRSRGYERFGQKDLITNASFRIEDFSNLKQMLETNEPVIIRDTSKNPDWVRLEGEEFLHSYAATPIIVRNKVIGFLNVDSTAANFFKPVHIETLKTFADYAAIAIDNAQMHQKIQRHAKDLKEKIEIATREIHKRANELETLNKIDKDITSTLDLKTMLQIITDASLKIVDADKSIIFLTEDQRKEFKNIVGSGFSQEELQEFTYEEFMQSINGWVFKEKKPAFSINIQKDKRQRGSALAHSKRMQDHSTIVAPLVIEKKMIGTLSVINTKGKRSFKPDDLNLIVMLADQASIAIQNGSLYEKAQEADRLKSAFLASMSHELRTPLNSIIGFTGILLQGLVGPLNDEQKMQLGMVRNSSNHLLELINDILDISKIEAGQLVVSQDAFSLRESVEKAIHTITPLSEMKGLKLVSVIPPEIGMIVSDQRRVEQILLNLLNNAVKFTHEGEVRLECMLKKNRIVISVTDTGIGIKENDQARLFNPFQQIDSGLSRKYEGTGLGLSICKRLVEKLGGKIWLKSQWEKGSTFYFDLPLKIPGAQS
jgi:signal transduction histidine kinase